MTVSWLTITRNAQNRASCLKILMGFSINTAMMTLSASGFTKGGTLNEALYRKLSTLRVQMTPKIAASSIRCCSDRWFRGSSSKISTWFTPDERHPYTFTPMRNKNSMTSSGPRYSRNATFRFSRDPSWNMAGKKILK